MICFLRSAAVLWLVLGLSGAPVHAEGAAEIPRGLWQTEPDIVGVVLHVRTRPCGRALCARVERAKNRSGIDAPSNAVGQQLIWSMKPQPDGAFFGEFRDTKANRYTQSRVEVAGKKLRIRACDATLCEQRVWVRVK